MTQKSPLTNVEIVTLAVYLLGGESKFLDIEDIAYKASQIAPGRFSWRKYADQINIRSVQKRLYDARNTSKAGYILGSDRQGWMLTQKGLEFGQGHANDLQAANLSRIPMTKDERVRYSREKTRMLATAAYGKIEKGQADTVTAQEAERFFHLDDYVTGKLRKEKLTRIINVFGADPDLGEAVRILSRKVRRI